MTALTQDRISQRIELIERFNNSEHSCARCGRRFPGSTLYAQPGSDALHCFKCAVDTQGPASNWLPGWTVGVGTVRP